MGGASSKRTGRGAVRLIGAGQRDRYPAWEDQVRLRDDQQACRRIHGVAEQGGHKRPPE
jgi:hypothetical protein